MKCLSLTQPWATLAAIGAKRIETRSWTTDYRGPLAIHASKEFPVDYQMMTWGDPYYSALRQAGYLAEDVLQRPLKWLPTGAIVAVCDLVDVVRIDGEYSYAHVAAIITRHLHLNELKTIEARMRYRQELAFGDYTPGRYMWLLSNVVALPKPIPAKGSLGLWEAEIEDPRGP